MTAIFPFRAKRTSPVSRRRSDVDRLFDDFLDSWTGLGDVLADHSSATTFSPKLSIKETEDAYRVSAELPGMTDEDIEVGFSDNTLTLKGERKLETSDESEKFKYNEISYGSFYRSIPLSEEVDGDKIEAEFKNGILSVSLPKRPELQAAQKKIKIKNS